MEEKHIPIPGEYYYVEEGSFWMIGKQLGGSYSVDHAGNIRDRASFIARGEKLLENAIWCYCDGNKRWYRLAFPEEIAWLQSCLEKGEYIEKEKALMGYCTYSVY